MEAKDLMYDWIAEQGLDFRTDLVGILLDGLDKRYKLDIVLDRMEWMSSDELLEVIEYGTELREQLLDDEAEYDKVYDDGDIDHKIDMKRDDERMEREGL